MRIFVKFLQIWHLNLILWVFKGEFGVEMEPDSILQNGRSFFGIGGAEHRTPLLDGIQPNERYFEPECNFGKWTKVILWQHALGGVALCGQHGYV